MFTAYVVVTLLTVAVNAFSAGCDFVRLERIVAGMRETGVPESWMTMLGVLKAAGALGLLAGFAVPLVGTAAAVGLVLFFVAAVGTHLRVGDYAIGLPGAFLALAVATLVLGVAHRGAW